MKKFNFLVGHGLKKRLKRKAFIIANAIIFVLVVVFASLPAIISRFSSSDDADLNVKIEVYNFTEQEDFIDELSLMLNAPYGEYTYYILEPVIEAFNEDAFWEVEKDAAIIIEGTIENPDLNIYTNDIDLYTTLSRNIEILLINYQIDDYITPDIGLNLGPEFEDQEREMMLLSILTILLLPMFILVVSSIQMIGVDIIEEKSTKAIETIIASVPAKTHFYSKIISILAFMLIQAALIFLYGLVGTQVSKLVLGSASGTDADALSGVFNVVLELMPNWQIVLSMTVLFVIVGTLMYLVIAALFASMAVTQEDYQQFQTPVMLILLGSFYISMFAPMLAGGTVIKVLSFIPLFSPMLTPVAYASGALTLVQAVISLLVLILTLVVLTILFTPVYRVSILSYDQTRFFKRIKSYFKKGYQTEKKNNKK